MAVFVFFIENELTQAWPVDAHVALKDMTWNLSKILQGTDLHSQHLSVIKNIRQVLLDHSKIHLIQHAVSNNIASYYTSRKYSLFLPFTLNNWYSQPILLL